MKLFIKYTGVSVSELFGYLDPQPCSDTENPVYCIPHEVFLQLSNFVNLGVKAQKTDLWEKN